MTEARSPSSCGDGAYRPSCRAMICDKGRGCRSGNHRCRRSPGRQQPTAGIRDTASTTPSAASPPWSCPPITGRMTVAQAASKNFSLRLRGKSNIADCHHVDDGSFGENITSPCLINCHDFWVVDGERMLGSTVLKSGKGERHSYATRPLMPMKWPHQCGCASSSCVGLARHRVRLCQSIRIMARPMIEFPCTATSRSGGAGSRPNS